MMDVEDEEHTQSESERATSSGGDDVGSSSPEAKRHKAKAGPKCTAKPRPAPSRMSGTACSRLSGLSRLSGGRVSGALGAADENFNPNRRPPSQLSQRISGGAAQTYMSAPFKMPVPNFKPSEGRFTPTLGPRKLQMHQLYDALLHGATVVDPKQAKAKTVVDEANAKPLLIYDPAADEDETRRTTLQPVYVEPRLACKLRPHQVEGVTFMFACLAGLQPGGHTGAILMDGMGLGKTFQSICAMWTLVTTGLNGAPTIKRPLFLCPSSLVGNWGKELRKWVGEDLVDPVCCVDTSGPAVKKAINSIWGFAPGHRKQQVLVMAYSTFRTHKELVKKKNIDLVVCDEAHVLKNGESKITKSVSELPAERRLLLSGTPVQNNLTEFFSLFHVAVPKLLGTAAEFRKKYDNPIMRGQDAGATDRERQVAAERNEQLNGVCAPYRLRRTCGVMAKYLPPKVEQVVFCKMSALQLKLYKHFSESAPVQAILRGGRANERRETQAAIDAAVKDAVARGEDPEEAAAKAQAAAGQAADLSVLVAINALKKLCCHPDLIWDMLARKAKDPDKAHITTGFEGSGPVFSAASSSSSTFKYTPGKSDPMHSGKIMVLVSLLKAIRKHAPTDKVVLVSNYTEALDVAKVMAQEQGWPCYELTGDMAVGKRQPTVDKFNSDTDPSFLLLLSSKAGGTGLNIIGANRLVLLDPDWNPANDLQAMARVWREGQKKKVWIYRLLTTGSIEEKIYQRQLMKQELSKSVVDGGGGGEQGPGQFSVDELRQLFRVDPGVVCDTHSAIKCKCDGSRKTMEAKATAVAQRMADEAQARLDAGNTEEYVPEDAPVIDHAHLTDPTAGPDEMWKHIPDHVRRTYVTYAFSDHITKPELVAEAEVQEEEEEEEEEGKEEEEEESNGEEAGCDGDGDG